MKWVIYAKGKPREGDNPVFRKAITKEPVTKEFAEKYPRITEWLDESARSGRKPRTGDEISRNFEIERSIYDKIPTSHTKKSYIVEAIVEKLKRDNLL